MLNFFPHHPAFYPEMKMKFLFTCAKQRFLFLLLTLCASSTALLAHNTGATPQPPVLGTYPATSVTAGQNTTVTPSAAPTGATSITASANTNFTGLLTVSPTTGVVTVTDAKQAGTYTVTVTAFNGGGSTTATFTLSVTAPPARCQGLFSGSTNVTVGTNSISVAIGDFNGDGKQDFAAANSGSNTVSIRLGDGLGGFSGTTNVTVGTQPISVAIGDFNGDGKQDFAAANAGSNTVSIRLGDNNEVNVRGNGVDIVDGDNTPSTGDHTDFGSTNIGVGFARTFTIQNTGGLPLTISGITSSNARFVVSGPPTTVAGNASATFMVTFTLTASGTQNATITINDDDCDEAVYDFAVTGNGACPDLTAVAPAVQVTNSTCGVGCIVEGGSIAAPTGSCPVGSTQQYQVNGGAWSSTLPTYAQTAPAQTIKTRCSCNADPTTVSAESAPVTTVPGTISAPTVPANGTATVACLALVTPPMLPMVNNCAGGLVTPTGPVITDTPSPLGCEGTRTYAYTYSCGGSSSTWSFVYTIERLPFTISTPNGAATVNNPALAICSHSTYRIESLR